jgi:hypothetical protein
MTPRRIAAQPNPKGGWITWSVIRGLAMLALPLSACVTDLSFPAQPSPSAARQPDAADTDVAPVPLPTDGSAQDAVEPGLDPNIPRGTPGIDCDPNAIYNNVSDGCTASQLCLRRPTANFMYCANCPGSCYEALPCPTNGVCNVGSRGALCNDNYFPTKNRVCLPNTCVAQNNCPQGFNCVGRGAVIAVGFCSGGAPFEPCTKNTECKSNKCTLLGPIGVCQ